MRNACRHLAKALALLLAPVLLSAAGVAAAAASSATSPIRTTAANRVPACVTPQRLMAFLATRTPDLDPRYRDIALWYKKHGEAWRVRWDYAFFQMAIETNFLSFQRGDGRRGDVEPKQNNFAGIGTTGGGVPGDSYPNVATGVLAQIQHLVVYSGERIANPIAPRTQLKQDDILAASGPILVRRPVTFQDLTGRWAADRAYGRSIETIAERYRELYCSGPPAPVEVAARTPPRPAQSYPRPPEPIAAVRPRPAVTPRDQLAALAARAAADGPLRRTPGAGRNPRPLPRPGCELRRPQGAADPCGRSRRGAVHRARGARRLRAHDGGQLHPLACAGRQAGRRVPHAQCRAG